MIKTQFIGEVETKWLTKPEKKHRQMALIREFSFGDSRGEAWTVPIGTVINGQSFPEWKKRKSWGYNLSRSIGYVATKIMGWHPFVGNGRRASVVHDYFVDAELKPSGLTHKMFHEAMLADDQPKWLADIMYWAVKNFGPKW